MKKTPKKLVLARETVRNLGTNEIAQVAGQADYSTWFTLCETGCCTIT